jgi:hypothetical protein
MTSDPISTTKDLMVEYFSPGTDLRQALDILFSLTEKPEPTRLLMVGWDHELLPTVWTEVDAQDSVLKPCIEQSGYRFAKARRESHTFERYFPNMLFGWFADTGWSTGIRPRRDPDPKARLVTPQEVGSSNLGSTDIDIGVTQSSLRALPPNRWPSDYGEHCVQLDSGNVEVLNYLLTKLAGSKCMTVEHHEF